MTYKNFKNQYLNFNYYDCFLKGVNGTQIEVTFFDLYTQPWFFTYFDYVMVAKDGDYKRVDK